MPEGEILMFRGMTFFQIFPFWLWPSVGVAIYLLAMAQNSEVVNPLTHQDARQLGTAALVVLFFATPINLIALLVTRREWLIWPTGVLVCAILIASREMHPSFSGAFYGLIFLVWGVVVRTVVTLLTRWLRRRKQTHLAVS